MWKYLLLTYSLLAVAHVINKTIYLTQGKCYVSIYCESFFGYALFYAAGYIRIKKRESEREEKVCYDVISFCYGVHLGDTFYDENGHASDIFPSSLKAGFAQRNWTIFLRKKVDQL